MNIVHKLTIQLISMSSFLHGDNTYILVHEDSTLAVFEAVVPRLGIAPKYTHKIAVSAKEWENAKHVYSELLKEQVQLSITQSKP